MASTLLQNMKRTVDAQLGGYNNHAIEQIFNTRSEDCVYEFLPKSLNYPAMDNAAYKDYYDASIAPLQNFKFVPDNYIYDEPNRKAAVHGLTTADTPVGPLVNECSIFWDFNESGNKITRVREMVDSAAIVSIMAKLQEFQAANAGSNGS